MSLPIWIWNLPLSLIKRCAGEAQVDPYLMAALVMTESRGETMACRFEANWRYFNEPASYAKALGISPATESNHQATSWGLMQLMGGTARDIGFKDHLPKLLEPEIGLSWGSKLLRRLTVTHPDQKDQISAYNAGTPRKSKEGVYDNQAYVDKVLGFLREIK